MTPITIKDCATPSNKRQTFPNAQPTRCRHVFGRHDKLLANLWGHSSGQLPPTDPTQAIANLRQLADLQKQYAQTLDLPESDYREWLNSLEAIRKANPLAEAFLSAIEASVRKTQAMTVMNAMAAAGLAVAQNGTDALQSHPDPTTGQPFTYKQTPDGFELESSFQIVQKPLSLSFK